jgi:hypothetical protein
MMVHAVAPVAVAGHERIPLLLLLLLLMMMMTMMLVVPLAVVVPLLTAIVLLVVLYLLVVVVVGIQRIRCPCTPDPPAADSPQSLGCHAHAPRHL